MDSRILSALHSVHKLRLIRVEGDPYLEIFNDMIEKREAIFCGRDELRAFAREILRVVDIDRMKPWPSPLAGEPEDD